MTITITNLHTLERKNYFHITNMKIAGLDINHQRLILVQEQHEDAIPELSIEYFPAKEFIEIDSEDYD